MRFLKFSLKLKMEFLNLVLNYFFNSFGFALKFLHSCDYAVLEITHLLALAIMFSLNRIFGFKFSTRLLLKN